MIGLWIALLVLVVTAVGVALVFGLHRALGAAQRWWAWLQVRRAWRRRRNELRVARTARGARERR